jgi:endonuclease/exonuclease/phosphatase family metal-dependent hydrolase
MRAVVKRTRQIWLPSRLGGWITRLNQGFFRSGLSGQGNAILLRDGLVPLERRFIKISRGQRERRICMAARLEGVVIGNLHASGVAGHPEVGAAEIARALAFIEEFARPGDALVLAGDFNLRRRDFPPLHGWSLLGPGIDHILVRGAEASPLEVWPEARRTTESGVLSDHAPIELTVGIDDSGKLDG